MARKKRIYIPIETMLKTELGEPVYVHGPMVTNWIDESGKMRRKTTWPKGYIKYEQSSRES